MTSRASVSFQDHYATLEVAPFAALDTIRESYKRLALRFHPDKNKDSGATGQFQRLVDAWETLRDGEQRREYDSTYNTMYFAAKRDGAARTSFEEVNRRREEVDREATRRWNFKPTPPEDHTVQRQRARSWKEDARRDYQMRLQRWTNFRDGRLVSIQERQVLLRRNDADLSAQLKVPEDEMIRQFQAAIERSRAIGHKIQDHAATLRRLLDARERYIRALMTSIEDNQRKIQDMMREMETERQKYEVEEARAREMRVREALKILGPRDLNPPLFCLIDRRGQAINRWKALSRVKSALMSILSPDGAAEGPWHSPGEWERVGGEHTCSRCGRGAYHIMLECGPAQCPGCGMIVCNDCHRDLQLLREYEGWITGPADKEGDCFFSMEFGVNPIPKQVWVGDEKKV